MSKSNVFILVIRNFNFEITESDSGQTETFPLTVNLIQNLDITSTEHLEELIQKIRLKFNQPHIRFLVVFSETLVFSRFRPSNMINDFPRELENFRSLIPLAEDKILAKSVCINEQAVFYAANKKMCEEINSALIKYGISVVGMIPLFLTSTDGRTVNAEIARKLIADRRRLKDISIYEITGTHKETHVLPPSKPVNIMAAILFIFILPLSAFYITKRIQTQTHTNTQAFTSGYNPPAKSEFSSGMNLKIKIITADPRLGSDIRNRLAILGMTDISLAQNPLPSASGTDTKFHISFSTRVSSESRDIILSSLQEKSAPVIILNTDTGADTDVLISYY